MSVIMLEKDVSFLLKCEIINDYPLLKSFLEAHKKIKSEDIEDSDSTIFSTFNDGLYQQILFEGRGEWIFKEGIENPFVVEFPQKENRKCQYCKKAPLEEIFYIENIRNNKVLEVGNRCIISLGIKNKADINKIAGNARSLFRLSQLNNKFSNIKHRVEAIDSKLKETDIIVPPAVSSTYKENGRRIQELYNQYLDPKTPNLRLPEIEKRFKDCLSEHKKNEGQIADYISKVEAEPLVAKKSYEFDLRNVPPAINQMHATGFVGKLGVGQIKDLGFIKKIAPYFSRQLQEYGIKLQNVFKLGYKFTVNHRKENFYISLENLVSLIGETLFDEPILEKYSENDFLELSILADTYSISIATKWLLSHTAYTFELFSNFGEIVFYPKSNHPSKYPRKSEDGESITDAILRSWDSFYRVYKTPLITRGEFDEKDLIDFIYHGERIVFSDYIETRD